MNYMETSQQQYAAQAGGQYITPSQERIWGSQKSIGWFPILGPMAMDVVRARESMSGAISGTIQTARGYGSSELGQGLNTEDFRYSNDVFTKSLMIPGSNGAGVLDFTNPRPRNGANAMMTLYKRNLEMTPELARSGGKTAGWLKELGGIYDNLGYDAPQIMDSVFSNYSRDFQFMQQKNRYTNGGNFMSGAGEMASTYASTGNMGALGNVLAMGTVGGGSALIDKARTQMNHELSAMFSGLFADVKTASASAMRSMGMEVFSGIGTTGMDGSGNTVSRNLAAAQQGAGAQASSLAAKLANFSVSGQDSDVEYKKLQQRYYGAAERWASLGRSRGMGNLDYLTGIAGSRAGIASTTGFDPSKYAGESASYYQSYADNPETWQGGVGLNTLEHSQMVLKAKGAKRQQIEQRMGYAATMAGVTSSIGESMESIAITTGNTSGLQAGQSMQMSGLVGRIDALTKALESSRGFGPAFTGPMEAEKAQLMASLTAMRLRQVDVTTQQYGRAPAALGAAASLTQGSLSGISYGLQTAELSSWRAGAMASAGAGPGAMAEANLGVMQSYMGLTGFSPTPESAERLGSAQFSQQVLGSTFGSRGSMRGAVREGMGAVGEQLQQLMAQKAQVLAKAPPGMRAQLELQFNSQIRGLQSQQLAGQQQLENGWLERIVSATWNAPSSADLVMSEFNYSGAISSGIKGRHLGGTSDDLLMQQEYPLQYSSYGAGFNQPRSMAASALSGVTDFGGNEGSGGPQTINITVNLPNGETRTFSTNMQQDLYRNSNQVSVTL
jgi:hypothetical protein